MVRTRMIARQRFFCFFQFPWIEACATAADGIVILGFNRYLLHFNCCDLNDLMRQTILTEVQTKGCMTRGRRLECMRPVNATTYTFGQRSYANKQERNKRRRREHGLFYCIRRR